MRKRSVALMIAPGLVSIAAAGQPLAPPEPGLAFLATPVAIEGSNLPIEPLGVSDHSSFCD